MNNKKIACTSCIKRDYSKGFRTFRLVPIYNNRFAKTNENPVHYINKIKKNNTLNTNRNNCHSCTLTTKQQKLTIRHKPTPWRMPYNHNRKRYICQKNFTCEVEEMEIKKINVNNFYFLKLWQEGPSAPGNSGTYMYDPTNSDSITYNGHDCSDKDWMRFYDNGGFRIDFFTTRRL